MVGDAQPDPGADRFIVEVAYALPEQQRVIEVELSPGATCRDAIEASGILNEFPQIDLAATSIGVFGEVCPLDQTVEAFDRMEIYRPLQVDPREQRRRRVEAARRDASDRSKRKR